LKQAATLRLVEQYQPDLICVVCFPHLFPPALLALPRFGCLNLHPSLLPAYRGPAPLFWQIRHGQKRGGVTLHFLDEGIDSGDIVAQRTFDLPEGIAEHALTELCATTGAELLIEALAQPVPHPLPRSPQPTAGASYFAAPTATDLTISTDWSAQHACNFLRGAASWPLSIQVGGFYVQVAEALDYDPEQVLGRAYTQFQDQVLIQFNPGILRIRRAT
jgi:methionyl-tRNA formyltransferase